MGKLQKSSLGSGPVKRIYKQIAKNTTFDELVIERIRGYLMRVRATRDLLNSGGSMPIITKRGRWSKTNTVMRYL